MTSTYELLSDPNQSLQDAGLYNGQVRACWLKGGEGGRGWEDLGGEGEGLLLVRRRRR